MLKHDELMATQDDIDQMLVDPKPIENCDTVTDVLELDQIQQCSSTSTTIWRETKVLT